MGPEVFYLDRDNTIDLLLTADGDPVDLSPVSDVILEIDETTIDSDTYPNVFTWTGLGVTGKLVIDLNEAESASLSAGTYQSRLIIVDPSNSDGIVWGEFTLIIKP